MYFSHLFQINFSIGSHPSFTYEIHNPLFALIVREVESLRQVAGHQKHQTGTLKECSSAKVPKVCMVDISPKSVI
jgi:hypothetical protein